MGRRLLGPLERLSLPARKRLCRIGANGFNAYKLYLDDELIVEFEGPHDHHVTTKDVELEAGRFYRLRLDYSSLGVDSRAQLLWAWPNVDYRAEALAAAAKAGRRCRGHGPVAAAGARGTVG